MTNVDSVLSPIEGLDVKLLIIYEDKKTSSYQTLIVIFAGRNQLQPQAQYNVAVGKTRPIMRP